MKTQALLEKVAQQGLNCASAEDLVVLACAFWYESFLPDTDRVKQLPDEQQAIIGYLTEFFSTFNCIEEKHALDLLAKSAEIKSRLKPVENKNNVDDLAGEWGLVENLNKYLGNLLFYQTRHYDHSKK